MAGCRVVGVPGRRLGQRDRRIQAYDTFARACETNALKVMLSTEG